MCGVQVAVFVREAFDDHVKRARLELVDFHSGVEKFTTGAVVVVVLRSILDGRRIGGGGGSRRVQRTCCACSSTRVDSVVVDPVGEMFFFLTCFRYIL